MNFSMNGTEKKAIKEKLDFAKHVKTDGQHLSSPGLTRVKSRSLKFENLFSKNANDLGFKNQREHKIKLKADPKFFRRVYGNMSLTSQQQYKKCGRTS